jgi:cell division septum initiation protein DivIVA
MHDAITSLLTEREEHLSRIETLQAKVDGASAQHELEMRDLRKKIKELQDEIDVLRNGSASKIADLRDRIAELEARVAQLLDDKRALAVALESQVGARFIQCRRAGEGVRGRMCFGVCLCWRSARAERAR